MKSVTVPFFISHQGCPHTCLFCDQRTISGSRGDSLPTAESLLRTIGAWQATANSRPLKVAFFGGTFTALPRNFQQALLEPLQPLLKSGTLAGIRLSTRPDYITTEQVQWLVEMGVTTIELGVQSMDDAVLKASGRGHNSTDSLTAIGCIKMEGVTVGAQLMPGLPEDSFRSSLDSLEQVIAAGADFVRLYPTVVLQGTELAEQFRSGHYRPLSLERGITLCSRLLHRAMVLGTPVIRIGLQADSGLSEQTILAGCWHPALGQLVRSRLYEDLLSQVLTVGDAVTIFCHPARHSDIVGLKRQNLIKLSTRGVSVKVLSDSNLFPEEVLVAGTMTMKKYSIMSDLNYDEERGGCCA